LVEITTFYYNLRLPMKRRRRLRRRGVFFHFLLGMSASLSAFTIELRISVRHISLSVSVLPPSHWRDGLRFLRGNDRRPPLFSPLFSSYTHRSPNSSSIPFFFDPFSMSKFPRMTRMRIFPRISRPKNSTLFTGIFFPPQPLLRPLRAKRRREGRFFL